MHEEVTTIDIHDTTGKTNLSPVREKEEQNKSTGNQGRFPDTRLTTTRPVQRVTALRCRTVCPAQKSRRARLKTAEHELLHDSDIPYEDFEKALRGIICSLVEREDRAHEALLLRLNDLEYRVDDLENGECP